MSRQRLGKWRKEFQLSGYAPIEERRSFAHLSAKVGLKKAAEQAGVSTGSVVAWRAEFGVVDSPLKRHYTAEEKKAALELCEELDVPTASRQLGIPKATLYNWRRRQRR